MKSLTKAHKETVEKRLKNDPEFAIHLLDEAINLFLNDEPETARLVLRDLVNATIGFEQLADATHKNSKSLHRMLTVSGNPSMNNLTNIIGAIRHNLNVDIKVQAFLHK